MLNVIEYKEICGLVEYLPDSKAFQVKTVSTVDIICVTGRTAEEIESRFAQACEEHIAKCKKLNLPSRVPMSGKIEQLSINPDLHEKAMMACMRKSISMDELVERALNKYLGFTY